MQTETAAAPPRYEPPPRHEPIAGAHLPLLIAMTVAHAVVDTYATTVYPLLPFWQEKFGLTYGLAGLIAAVASLTGSVAQPLVGIVTDRGRDPRWVALSVATATVGISLIGVMPAYGAFLAMVVIGGIGVAGFHPQGYKIVGSYAGRNSALATSWFLVGGNVGVALGPIVGTSLVLWFGTAGTLGLAPVGLAIAAYLWWAVPRWTAAAPGDARPKAAPAPPPMDIAALGWARRVFALAVLVLLVALRSTISSSFNSYVPLYFVREAGQTEAFASQVLSVMLLIGAGATLAGGHLADRYGRLRVLALTLAGVPLTVAAFLALPAASPVAIAMLWASGALILAGFSITVVLAQELWFERRALASGLIVGFAFGMGGLLVPGVGTIADVYGLRTALLSVGFLALLPLVLTAVVGWLLSPGNADRREGTVS
ncbi:MAG: MFS transporter [Chloroflexi bacterium]|jgi:FSR family fosmidomycin resistance protein-like MFS transporter|nr:MFS transporter [Chloroflexota bacterium]